jgi:hypothetical protein
MKRSGYIRKTFGLILFALMATVSCTETAYVPATFENTPIGNFKALWNIMDRHYCFFDLKKRELGVDWDSVYVKYEKLIDKDMSDLSLYEVLNNMLRELKDGHVNLYGYYDVGPPRVLSPVQKEAAYAALFVRVIGLEPTHLRY